MDNIVVSSECSLVSRQIRLGRIGIRNNKRDTAPPIEVGKEGGRRSSLNSLRPLSSDSIITAFYRSASGQARVQAGPGTAAAIAQYEKALGDNLLLYIPHTPATGPQTKRTNARERSLRHGRRRRETEREKAIYVCRVSLEGSLIVQR